MSAADVEVVREMLDAFNRQDYERSTELFDDEVEMRQAAEVPDSDTYRGKEEFLRGMALWLSGFERGMQYTPEELIDCGDAVLARVMIRGVGRGSGVKLEQRVFQLYEVRGGKIVQLHVFWSEADSRHAAGLAPG